MKRQRIASIPGSRVVRFHYNLRTRPRNSRPEDGSGPSTTTLSVVPPIVNNTSESVEGISDVLEIQIPDGVEKIEEIYTDSASLLDISYVMDNISFLKVLEEQRRLPVDFLAGVQPAITPKARSVIIDWLLRVQHYLELLQETLYLCVNIIDHYVSSQEIVKVESIQLIVVVAILISCKIEERSAPKISKLIQLTDYTYGFMEVLVMEERILIGLDFNFNFASPLQFLSHLVKVLKVTKSTLTMSCYFIDVMVHDVRSVRFCPSMLAASAVYLARKILLPEGESFEWNLSLQFYSGYREDALQPVVELICDTLINVPHSRYRGAVDKYASVSKYRGISKWAVLNPDSIKKLKDVR